MNRYLLLLVPGFALLVWRPEWTSVAALGAGVMAMSIIFVLHMLESWHTTDRIVEESWARTLTGVRSKLDELERKDAIRGGMADAVTICETRLETTEATLKRLQENVDALSNAITQRGGAQKPRL